MAVYTPVSETDIALAAALYGLTPPVTLKPIAEGVENSNYLLEHVGGKAILTLYEQRVRTEDLPFFLGLMQHLASHGIPCPLPMQPKGDSLVIQLAGKSAAMVTFLQGKSTTRIQPWHCAALGQHLAAMHLAAADFSLTRENALSMHSWRPLWEAVKIKAAEAWPHAVELVEAQLASLEKNWPQHLPTGIIHADLFPDNVFYEGERLSGLIDFYFACRDMLAYDLAICLNAWCFETNTEFNITRSQRMLEAYTAKRPLSKAEQEAFPVLCRGAAMRFLLTRMTDWLNPKPGAIVTPKNPLDYLARLKFHATAESFSAYGLTS